MVQREEVGLYGNAHRGWSTGKLTQDGLTADDHDRIVGGDDSGGADEVLELVPGHDRREKASRVSRQIFQRS